MVSSKSRWSEAEQVEFFSHTEILDLIASVYAAAGAVKTATLVELHHRPGAGVSGLFEVVDSAPAEHPVSFAPQGASPDALNQVASHSPPGQPEPSAEPNSDASVAPLFVVATSEVIDAEAPNVVRMSSGRGDLTFWEHPHDPGLVGLSRASIPESVQETWGNGAALIDLETMAYRPLRRAVLKATFAQPTGTIFLKVLRKDAEILRHKHELLFRAGVPVPATIGPLVDGVVAIAQVRGMPLAQAIMDSRIRPISGGQIISLLTAFPAEIATMPSRPAWTDRLSWYAHAARTAIPGSAARIDALVARIERVLETAERGPLAPNHGDFYEANVFVENGLISGLIDIDSAGPGYLIDDLACFVGHLAVLPTLDERYAHVPRFVDEYLEDFADYLRLHGITVDGLYARSAGIVLTLIAGARDEENPEWEKAALARLELAEDLMNRVVV